MILSSILITLLGVFLTAEVFQKDTSEKEKSYEPIPCGKLLDKFEYNTDKLIKFAEWQQYIKEEANKKEINT
jgi:hypothetical protein